MKESFKIHRVALTKNEADGCEYVSGYNSSVLRPAIRCSVRRPQPA
jgi:hypothetical protein